MDTDRIVEILKSNEVKHPNDSRQIIKHKNNILYGNQIGVVLSNPGILGSQPINSCSSSETGAPL